MAKEKIKKSNPQVGKEEEKKRLVEEAVETILREGEQLGNDIIEMIPLKEVDRVVLGIAVLGLAKALAMVKDIARRTGIDIDKLHQKELMHYRRMFAKIHHGDESKKK